MASDINSDSSGSDSGSTPEEERIRRLFQTCDGNGDGFIDSQDLLAVCRQLNLENCVGEIMEQLGADDQGRISYGEFLRTRMRLINEINALTLHDQVPVAPPIAPPNLESPAPSTTHWLTSSDSLGSQGARSKHESWEFDSGARDLSPEPNTLHKLIEAAGGTLSGCSNDLLELANKLHLAKLDSLKGRISELTSIVQHTAHERDVLERQLSKTQLERMRLVREQDQRLEQQEQRYEERLTELHSVIAELSKKLDVHKASIIKEEDEMSQQSCEGQSENQSTSNDNNATESCSERDLSNLEEPEISGLRDEASSGLGDNESSEDRPAQACPEERNAKATSCHSLQVQQLQEEAVALHEQLARTESELHLTRIALAGVREERDRLHRKVRELQTKLAGVQSQQGLQPLASPTRSDQPPSGSLSPRGEEASPPIPKMAERIRLKKIEGLSDRHILGSEIASIGYTTAKIAEHLSQNVKEESRTQEIFQTLFSAGSPVPENKIKEFEVETERLNSRIEHLRSQNDLLQLSLEESRAGCDRLSVLIGKYESNSTALRLALSCSDQAIEAAEVLAALTEAEQDLLRANCRAVGLVKSEEENQEKILEQLKEAQENRRSAENVARHFLQKLDHSYGIPSRLPQSHISPWEDVSSHTTSSTSSSVSSGSGADSGVEFTRAEERRLRDHLQRLKAERAAVRTTIVELESVHVDPHRDPPTLIDAQKLDLENAVLMQELMAMKEEKAELKAQVYLLEKEKTSLELQLGSREAQEQAYLLQIRHFRSECQELQRRRQQGDNGNGTPDEGEEGEKVQKLREEVQELVVTLDSVTKNSELRAQQSVEFVNDLKRTNSALVTAFEKAKKKQQAKVQKLEIQMSKLTERHNAQVRMLKQRIAMLEGDTSHKPLQTPSSDV